jgi:hypothetical protein
MLMRNFMAIAFFASTNRSPGDAGRADAAKPECTGDSGVRRVPAGIGAPMAVAVRSITVLQAGIPDPTVGAASATGDRYRSRELRSGAAMRIGGSRSPRHQQLDWHRTLPRFFARSTMADDVIGKKCHDVTQNFLRHNRAVRKSNLQT